MKRFAITALFLTAAMPAFAQQKQVVSFKVPEIKYTVSQNLPLSDAPDHYVRMWDTQAIVPANSA